MRQMLRGVHPLLGFAVVCQLVSAGTFSAMWAFGQPQQLLSLAWQTGVLLVVSSVVGIALGRFFLYTSVQRLGAALPACVGSVSPFLTAAMASVLLGETLSTAQWAAGMMTVTGAVVVLAAQQTVVRSIRHSAAARSVAPSESVITS